MLCLLATMAWVVGMADDENQDSGSLRGKKRRKQKASKSELYLHKSPLPRQWLCNQYHLSVCHSVQDYCKNNWSISLKLGAMIGPTIRKNCLTFSGHPAVMKIR